MRASVCVCVCDYAGGFERVVGALLDDGRADPSANRCASLIHACVAGHHRVAAALLGDRRTIAWARSGLALKLAAQRGDLEMARLLLPHLQQQRAAYNTDALLIALHREDEQLARMLVQSDSVDVQQLRVPEAAVLLRLCPDLALATMYAWPDDHRHPFHAHKRRRTAP